MPSSIINNLQGECFLLYKSYFFTVVAARYDLGPSTEDPLRRIRTHIILQQLTIWQLCLQLFASPIFGYIPSSVVWAFCFSRHENKTVLLSALPCVKESFFRCLLYLIKVQSFPPSPFLNVYPSPLQHECLDGESTPKANIWSR